jgi:predicted ATPase/class 3 adenylate cyclase
MDAQTTVAFGDLLKDYRLAAGLTQEALAEQAGVSARNIQNLERGENKPLKDTARRLAAALRLDERDRALLLTAVIPVPRRRGASAPPDAVQLAPQPVDGPDTPLPVGMLAVLVTDVRGYTAFTHAHGDEAGAALAGRFAALAGSVVTTEAGRVVEVRGDEVLAVFSSARAALRAATGILARCAEETSDALPLRAGIGLDVGEPVAVPGGYRGEAINTAARLCAQAGPGEVLASEAVVALARRIDGLAYDQRGELALKGITRPVRAWLVRAGEDEASSPAAAAPAVPATPVAPPRHNLPAALSSFIGRERDRARVGELLAASRLVTLTGSGGVGKTRLALATAEGLLDAYPDGVWLVELAPLTDSALTPGALAQVLGLLEEAGKSIVETIIGYLNERRLLLMLDNCEHLVEACAALASALLRAVPGLRILATSREALGMAGERTYRVPSLSTPDPKHLPVAELASSYEAVRLFVERAAERRNDFALSEANVGAIAELCARLDGVPLAIELAAARAGSMAVEGIAARLDDRFRLLTSGARDLPSRQRTLRATLDWSWDLLGEEERALLARFAVFAGGWTLEAAEAVCCEEGPATWAVLDGMDALVGKSLVQVDESGEGAGRYRLLETVRQYAAERLSERGEAVLVSDRHLAWCVALAEAAAPLLVGSDQGRWLDRLEAEHDNLRAALGWARQSGAANDGLRLAGALWRFWLVHGHVREGQSWLEAALASREGSAPDVQARALNAAGGLIV